ncbi:hypothetical protein [Aurantimonas sp. 22II-16-19i]|uniref:hypothetical protein n=1 Tax=Aurantimonas sp. 22II-16-19i TaxID=1317114 RepID=UPI0009F7E6D2|nr:hypothetical protein [Aurantimonas sp. 22II-16-19i]ORE87829.1 hypothetical protein ATO4_25098 [Aurantimonas sp. 22II-16-19i]
MANPGTPSGLLPTGDLPESLLGHELVGEQRDVRNFGLDVIAVRLLASGAIHDIIEVLKGTTGDPALVDSFTAYMNALGARLNTSVPTDAIVAPSGSLSRVEWRDSVGGTARSSVTNLATGALVARTGGSTGVPPTKEGWIVDANQQFSTPYTPDAGKPVAKTPAIDLSRRLWTPHGSYVQEIGPLVLPQLYHVGAGDRRRTLVVSDAGRTVLFEHLADGVQVRIKTKGVTARFDSGAFTTWNAAGVAGSPRFIDIPADSYVIVEYDQSTNKLDIWPARGAPVITAAASTAEVVPNFMVVMAGQSLGYRCFQGAGLAGVQRFLRNANDNNLYRFVNAAMPASSLLEGNDVGPGHWVKDNGTAGPLLTAMFAQIDALIALGYPMPSIVNFNQGQGDFDGINLNAAYTTMARYRDGLITLAALIAAKYPGCKLIVTPMPSRDGSTVGVSWQQLIRRAQLAAVAASANIEIGLEIYDLLRRFGDLHLVMDGGQDVQGDRLGRVIQKYVRGLTTSLGPRATTLARIDARNFDLTFEWDAGMSLDTQILNEFTQDIAVTSDVDAYKNEPAIRANRGAFQATVGSTRRYRFSTNTDLPNPMRASYPYGYCDDAKAGRAVFDGTTNLPLQSFSLVA